MFILVALLFAISAFAQTKGNNTITLTVKTIASTTYDDFIKYLVFNGFTIDNGDHQLMYFITGAKAPPCGKPNYRIKAFVKDYNIRINVEYYGSNYDPISGYPGPSEWKQWFYKKGGVMKDIYNGFYPILKEYSSDLIFETK